MIKRSARTSLGSFSLLGVDAVGHEQELPF